MANRRAKKPCQKERRATRAAKRAAEAAAKAKAAGRPPKASAKPKPKAAAKPKPKAQALPTAFPTASWMFLLSLHAAMSAGDASDAAPRGSRDPPPGLSWPEGMPLPVPAAKKDDEGDEGQENEESEEEEGFENDPLVEPTPPDLEKKKTKEEDEKKEEPKKNDDKKEEHASQTKPGVWKQLVEKGPGQWVWLRHCRYCKSSSYWRKGCCFKCSSEARLRMGIYEHLTWKKNPLAENYKPEEKKKKQQPTPTVRILALAAHGGRQRHAWHSQLHSHLLLKLPTRRSRFLEMHRPTRQKMKKRTREKMARIRRRKKPRRKSAAAPACA